MHYCPNHPSSQGQEDGSACKSGKASAVVRVSHNVGNRGIALDCVGLCRGVRLVSTGFESSRGVLQRTFCAICWGVLLDRLEFKSIWKAGGRGCASPTLSKLGRAREHFLCHNRSQPIHKSFAIWMMMVEFWPGGDLQYDGRAT